MAAHDLFPEEIYQPADPVTVVIDKPWNQITPSERELLTRVIGAIEIRPGHKLSVHAVRLVVQGGLQPENLPGRPANVIAFTQVPAGIPQYEVIRNPGQQMVAAEPLAALISNPESKNRLWSALQAQFTMAAKGG